MRPKSVAGLFDVARDLTRDPRRDAVTFQMTYPNHDIGLKVAWEWLPKLKNAAAGGEGIARTCDPGGERRSELPGYHKGSRANVSDDMRGTRKFQSSSTTLDGFD